MGTIADKLLYLAETKSKIKEAINAKRIKVTDSTSFRDYANFIQPTLQNKAITENGTYTADGNYDGLGIVVVDVEDSETELQDMTITENGIYTADSGYDGLGIVTVDVEGGEGGTAIPEPYASYIAEAEAVYGGEYANVIYAEGYGEHTGVMYYTVLFLLDNWNITAYDAATTEYTQSGFMMVQRENEDGEWVLSDFSATASDTHYAKNIKAASFYVEYEGLTLFPCGIGCYPDTTAIDYSTWDSGTFVETLETGDTLTYTVAFDEAGQPTQITAPDGTVTAIDWGES